ncbi:3-oxoacyl-[acyl-carrier protein] reductase [Amycolatopsis arida]|uniref:3-oxoacyl-[acyl-carrier protein] reductase n=1 Tax=Amycolatopsis arida TaxID=587909 RepID=A0A1I5SQC4_9PSEU|nr:SDR family oxidoreductase [Amycolatopsis arida]TDX96387.1 3-oxoacyl-[acyl-carrier protein] reductase [Amycolatopsis arida]SFP72992.1 3-oxoacyl-[acyl-carrier protein] reductase [Amycolatopsis arida]
MTEQDTAGRPVALVTGGGRGIGRASVLALAGAGFDVAVNYSRSETAAKEVATAAEALGARTLLVRADVADEPAVRELAAAVEARFDRLDALVNNAGTTTDTPPSDLDGLSMEDWDRIFAVNVRGTFQVTRACVPLLRRSAPAAVVNLASVVGLRPGPQPFPYAASKAAVVNLTRTLAGALGPEIRVNAIAPGWMEGEWMEHALGDRYPDLIARRAKRTPLRRCVTADDVAATITSLITSNPFVTGETVVIDGGYTATT